MKQINKIKFNKEYTNFFLLKDTCYFENGTDFGEITDDSVLILKTFENRFEMRAYPDAWIYLYLGKSNFLFDTAQKMFVEKQVFENYRIGNGNMYYFCMQNKTDPKTILFDVSQDKILWIKEKYFSFQILGKNILIYIGNQRKSLIRYDFSTGDPLWQYDLPSEFDWESQTYIDQINHHKADIQRLIGIYEGVLWVSLNSGRLLGLDVENGNLLYNISRLNHYDGEKAIFSQYYPNDTVLNPDWGLYFGKYLQLDESKGILFGLRNQYYYEIDLKNPNENYFLYDISESCKQWQIEADVAGYEWNWDGDEIFFGQNFSDGNNLGTFDRSKKEIVWATRIEKPNGQVHNFSKIDYATGRLYALDQTGTLHIFERE